MRFLFFIGVFLVPVSCRAIEVAQDELPSLTVRISDGKTYRGMLDSKTSSDRLWLRFGGTTTAIRRGFDWHSVQAITAREKAISSQDVINLAAGAQPPASPARNRIDIPPNSALLRSNPTRHEHRRIADVKFDVLLGNWDQDVETDGFLVQVIPVDENGFAIETSGTLSAELFSAYRIDQDAAAHGRGRAVRTVGQWSMRLDTLSVDSAGKWIRLPFQALHPEIDNRWSPVGLMHLQLIVPGEGVFHRSIDGIRIRPWASFRDGLERSSADRFLPTERQ